MALVEVVTNRVALFLSSHYNENSKPRAYREYDFEGENVRGSYSSRIRRVDGSDKKYYNHRQDLNLRYLSVDPKSDVLDRSAIDTPKSFFIKTLCQLSLKVFQLLLQNFDIATAHNPHSCQWTAEVKIPKHGSALTTIATFSRFSLERMQRVFNVLFFVNIFLSPQKDVDSRFQESMKDDHKKNSFYLLEQGKPNECSEDVENQPEEKGSDGHSLGVKHPTT
ncbi:hypothetical protein J6590_053121 [Homalodisca vitripennis]|nr:hypothetical protein J6590_053121 [Homalodisca vitripennis]